MTAYFHSKPFTYRLREGIERLLLCDKEDPRVGVPHLQEQAERAGVIKPGKEKASERLHHSPPAPLRGL